MKLWEVEVIQPKRKDKRKSRYRIIYTVHAKTAAAAEKRVRQHDIYAERDDKIGYIRESTRTIFDARYFSISPYA